MHRRGSEQPGPEETIVHQDLVFLKLCSRQLPTHISSMTTAFQRDAWTQASGLSASFQFTSFIHIVVGLYKGLSTVYLCLSKGSYIVSHFEGVFNTYICILCKRSGPHYKSLLQRASRLYVGMWNPFLDLGKRYLCSAVFPLSRPCPLCQVTSQFPSEISRLLLVSS